MRWFVRALKTLSLITLFFFNWSFLPLYSAVAYAASPQGQGTGGKGGQSPAPGAGELFEKAVGAIREKIGKADEKAAKGQDISSEMADVKTKRAEIDSLDVELRKEFSATETKLKDAKLPQEILDRHYKFVKHYDDNLKELKANLDAVGQYAADSKQGKDAIRKTKLHLDKVKTPSKHVPLDPNKLPFRTVKGKERAPRLKKEEFEKEFGPQKKQQTPKTAELWDADQRGWTRIIDSGLRRSALTLETNASRVLLAHNFAIASDMPLSLPRPSGGEGWGAGRSELPAFVFSEIDPQSEIYNPQLMVAQATNDAPTAADLAETPEVQFTPEIRTKAAELGHNPVKIYEWVRNNIEFVPTYGSIQGAQMTMETKLGNAFDTASLLIALYRASGIPARYVYATVEIPIEQAMNWVGGVTDPKMVGTIFATNGVPVKLMKDNGGVYKAVQLEHVFIKAFVDYLPSRGAVNKQGDTWVPMDPSFKQYKYTGGIDISSAVPLDAQTFMNQLQATATINGSEGYVTNVDSVLIKQTMRNYQTQVEYYIQQNHPNATVGDIIGKKTIIAQELGILVGTSPYRVPQTSSEFATVPGSLRATMNFSIPDSTGSTIGLFYNISLPEIAGKKITLSYDPATSTDASLLKSYQGDMTKVPAYMLKVRPVIKIEGNVSASGSIMQFGTSHSFHIGFSEPGIGTDRVTNVMDAGGYFAIVLETQSYTYDMIGKNAQKLKSTLEVMKDQLNNGMQSAVERDNLIGDWLWLQGLYYFYAQSKMLGLAEWLNGVNVSKGVSMAITSVVPSVVHLFDMPRSFDLTGYGIDVDRNMFTVSQKSGEPEKIKQFMAMAGSISSSLESGHVEVLSKMPAISSVNLLNAATLEGIPIYTIDKDNINLVLPKLQVSSEILDDINNAVNAGNVVTVQARVVSYYGMSGVGYIITNPTTGAAAYKISGGYNGGYQATRECLKDILLMLCSIAMPSGSFWLSVTLETSDWLDGYLESGNAINWTSISSAEIAFLAIMSVFAFLIAFGMAALAVTGFGAIAILAAIMAVAQIVMSIVGSLIQGKPWWCGVPCAPLLVYGYQNWFAEINYENPCATDGF